MAIQTDHKDIIDLIMGDRTQFHVPIYQRTYTWEPDNQVDKLLDDILEFGDEYKDNRRAEYYIGNVILKNQTRGMITERVVIDGQQRITTAILILCVIRDIYLNKFISDEGQRIASDIHKTLYSEEGNEIKLKLNNMENQQALTNLLSASAHSTTYSDKQTRYIRNYNHIHKRLTRMDERRFNNFLDFLRRVKVVIIFLDEDQDENSVFESINSLGKPLAGSDLIKNYLFTFKNYECSHSKERELTQLYTRTFEALFKGEKDVEEELESFFRIYIAVKTQQLVKRDPKIIYFSFKKLIGEITSIEMCTEIIVDLAKWGRIYQTIRVFGHNDIDLNYLGYLRTAFGIYATLLMDILNHYSHIEADEIIIDDVSRLNDSLKAVVAFDAARFIANYPTGELARFIPTVFPRLGTDRFEIHDSYGDKFRSLVTNTQEGYQQPSLAVLKRSALNNDLYGRKRQKLKKLLVLLENIGKKEMLNFEKDLKRAEIEHIIPQKMEPHTWPHITMEDHDKYLHTLGNLTLTFDNQKLSNLGFSEKKRILHDQSRILLNRQLLDYTKFDIEELEHRAQALLDTFGAEYLTSY